MIYQFKYRGKIRISCGDARKEEAHEYMKNKYGEGKYKVFTVESTITEEIKASVEFMKLKTVLCK